MGGLLGWEFSKWPSSRHQVCSLWPPDIFSRSNIFTQSLLLQSTIGEIHKDKSKKCLRSRPTEIWGTPTMRVQFLTLWRKPLRTFFCPTGVNCPWQWGARTQNMHCILYSSFWSKWIHFAGIGNFPIDVPLNERRTTHNWVGQGHQWQLKGNQFFAVPIQASPFTSSFGLTGAFLPPVFLRFDQLYFSHLIFVAA